MATNDTAALVVALSAQVDKFQKDMDKANAVANKSVKAIEDRFEAANREIGAKLSSLSYAASSQLGTLGSVLRTLGPAGTATAVAFGGAALAFKAMVDAAGELAEKAKGIRDFAESTGLSALQVQALSKAAGQVGVNSDEAQGAIVKLTSELDLLQKGQGTLREQLLRVNPSLVDQLETARSTSEAITILGKAFDGLDSTFQRNALAKAIGGRGGAAVVARLFPGLDLTKLAADLEASGKALDDNLIKKLPQLQLEIEKMSKKAKENIVSIFAEDALTRQRDFAQNILNISEAVKNFKMSADFKALLAGIGPSLSGAVFGNDFADNLTKMEAAISHFIKTGDYKTFKDTFGPAAKGALFGSPSPGPVPPPAAPTPALPQANQQQDEAQRLFELREKLIDQVAKYTKMAKEGESNPFFKEDAADAERFGKQLDQVEQKIADLNKTKSEPLKLTVTPAQQQPAAPTAAAQLQAFRESISLRENDLTLAEQQRLKQLEQNAAIEANQRVAVGAAAGMRTFTLAQQNLILAIKEQLGVATEQEIVETRIANLRALQAKGIISDSEKIAQAEAIIRKEAKETAQQLEVRASKLPQVTRYLQDARDASKQVDQTLANAFSAGENAFADFVTGAKNARQAFTDFANSVLRDIAKMAFRSLLGGLFGTAGTGGLSDLLKGLFGGGRASGGPVVPGKAYRVNENTPNSEWFFPGTPGQIVPNEVMRAPSGNVSVTVGGTVVYGNPDDATLRRLEAQSQRQAEMIRVQTRQLLSSSHASKTGVARAIA